MKQFLRASLIVLAIAVPAAAQAQAPLFNWTGFYAGVNAGYGWGDRTFTLGDATGAGLFFNGFFGPPVVLSPNSVPLDSSGFVGGGQVGYNVQFAPMWVAGLEADIQFGRLRDSNAVPTVFLGILNYSLAAAQSVDWFGTVRARLGFLPSDRLLVYVTGGLAYGHGKADGSLTFAGPGIHILLNGADGITCLQSIPCLVGSNSRTSVGWTGGAGTEFAIASNMTFKLEYLYVNLGRQTVVMTPTGPQTGSSSLTLRASELVINILRAGLNFKF